MAIAVRMPQMGESVVEGTVSRWLKAPGAAVERLEPLLEISTDKIDTEIPAPATGTLIEIVVVEGQTVDAGTILAFIGKPGESIEEVTEEEVTDPPIQAGQTPVQNASTDVHSSTVERPESKPEGRAFISPVVARIAAEQGIDLTGVPGTGAKGRITKRDLLAYIAGGDGYAPPTQSSISNLQPPPLSQNEDLLPLTPIRRAIAEHMLRSVQTSPHVTTIFEVDMTSILLHREAHRQDFADRGVRLTVTPYIVSAAIAALNEVPVLNSRFSEAGIVRNRSIHIGIAVARAAGLIVPVLHNAGEMSLQGLARAINQMTHLAHSGELKPHQVAGGTFTITNHGVGGSVTGTPILNQPQSGILGVGTIVKRPVVRSGTNSLLPTVDDAILIRPMAFLSLTFDHRLLDGAEADRFMTVVKTTLESWKGISDDQ